MKEVEIIVPISKSERDYISNLGNVYYRVNGKLKLKRNYQNKNGYVYNRVKIDGVFRTVRVHRLVAQHFIPNPLNLKIVGHKNNIKNDNRADNLYWTTTSENTQKAYDDGLARNDKGICDSQSYPIACYNAKNELVSVYGSIKEAGCLIKGYPSHSISKVIGNTKPGIKGYYFIRISKEQYFNTEASKRSVEFSTTKINKTRLPVLVENFNDISFVCSSQKEASIKTGISQGMISWLIKTNKPSKTNIKFSFVL